jgi:hypothetical protein
VVEAHLSFEMGGQPKKKSTGRPARTP